MVYKNINWLSVNKNPNDKKGVVWKKTKTNKEYPKVTQHRENDCKQRMVYNSARIRGRRNNISKSY